MKFNNFKAAYGASVPTVQEWKHDWTSCSRTISRSSLWYWSNQDLQGSKETEIYGQNARSEHTKSNPILENILTDI